MKKYVAAAFARYVKNCIVFYSFFNCDFSYAQDYSHPVIDVQHYTFSLLLNDENDLIRGETDISLLFLQKASSFDLDLVKKNASGKGMIVTAVTAAGEPVQFNQDDQRIHISAAANPGDTLHYLVKYEGIPADGLIIDKNKYGHRSFFGDNWPNRAHYWLPCIDNPIDKASVDFIITAPEHYQVIANGLQVEENNLPNHQKLTHWKETVALPVKVMVIGAADFAVNYAGDVDCIPVSSWIYPEDKDKGFYDYAQAKDILPFFIQQVGPYAYRKLANVQSKTRFGGMENASAIFYSENSIHGDRQTEALLAHEIAHQWFGNSVTEKSWPHVWLSEGFATYMEHLYFENRHGLDILQKELMEDRAKVIAFSKTRNTAIVDSTVNHDFFELLNANSYQKAGWVLHMLRRKLGDTVFWKGIRAYYMQYAGKNADTEDFRKVMETVSNTDLQSFFQQWLYTAGQPLLRTNITYDTKKKTAVITVEQLQGPLFNFPLELLIGSANARQRKTMDIQDRKNTITIAITGPVTVQLDPDVNLLFEQQIKKPGE
jgi:aminopeptidase N